MSKQQKSTPLCAVFSPFGGIDTRLSHSGTANSGDIVNFRLEENGHLYKREGFRYVTSCPDNIRAVWTGILNGKQRCLMLSSNSVISADLSTGNSSVLGKIGTTSGEAHFFYYRDALYLGDGNLVYSVSAYGVKQAEGYAPLVGKDWPTTVVGQGYEARNYLTRRARISYLIQEGFSAFLCTGDPLESIDAVYLNGKLLDPSQYQYDSLYKCITVPGLLQVGDRVLACFTYAESVMTEKTYELFTCSRSSVFGGSDDCSAFFWNGDDSYTIYPSLFVDNESLAAAKSVFPDSSPLYFPEHREFVLGDGRYPVTGFVSHYDRLLIFTKSSAWMAETDTLRSKTFSVTPINTHAGCRSLDGVTMTKNSPISVGQNTVYRWTSDTDERNECNAVTISSAIHDLLDDDFFEHAIAYRNEKRGELWFHAKNVDDTVWVYGVTNAQWYRFTGIRADGFFDFLGQTFFWQGQDLFVFDQSCYEDVIDASGTKVPITAVFQSNLLEYDTERKKRSAYLIFRGDCADGTIRVTLQGNDVLPRSCCFTDTGEHTVEKRRLPSGRFSYATLTLTATGGARQAVHSLVSKVL